MLMALRRRVLPWAVWLGAMATAGWLWWGVNVGSARGYVEGVAYGVAAPELGRIASIHVAPGQLVRAGQVIATLDHSVIDAELAELEAERMRVEAELGAVATQTQILLADNSRGVEETVDATVVARQQARASRSVAVAELAAVEEQLGTIRELVDKRMADKRELVELLVRRATLREQKRSADDIIRELDTAASAARARRDGVPVDATERVTEPLRAELGVIVAKQQQLQLRLEAMSLRAPGDGQVSSVLLRPGELALAGAVVATVVGGTALTAEGTPVVFACTSETDAAQVRPGEAVLLTATEGGREVLQAHVDRVASEVVQLPPRCWRDPRLPLWGRGVYIATDAPVSLVPGQGFSIKFTGRMSDHRPSESPAPAVMPAASTPPSKPTSAQGHPAAGPNAILVPTALRQRTRFEPSALAWSPARERYLVVSDDTGLPDHDDKAPWLFTMDRSGRVDEAPLVIEGLGEVSDLEAIAPAPDGGVFLLASQSRSRKGKRPPARQIFAHVAVTATEARATGSVRLASLLEAAGASTLAALGVDDLDALDIEGMTATAAGGVLLGLKGPVDAEQGAAIWHLRAPEALLAGDLAAAGLSLWGRVPLRVNADGREVPGGIADLLELDGELLIATTAALVDEPRTQDGAVVLASPREQAAAPRVLARFPGAKPEGLARNAAGDGFAIVFDAGDATPRWLEQRWPAP